MKAGDWQGVSYLDVLRPDPGWKIEHAVISTYSLDLVAAVAAMLALSGLDDEQGSGSRVDFAKSLETLRGRLRIVAQAGRIALPVRTPPVLAIIDQFIREVPADERHLSWHAKAALVKLRSLDGDRVEWRLWLGSRNLTKDVSWDTGLVLVAGRGQEGQTIPGMADLAQTLHQHADLPALSAEKVSKEVASLHWQAPPGLTVQEIQFLLPDTPGRQFPHAPDGIKELLVVSPFLDGMAVSHFSEWEGAKGKCGLISTRMALEKLARQTRKPLEAYSYLGVLDAPDDAPGDSVPAAAVVEATAPDDAETESRGLHAKIVAAQCGKNWITWIGSANATERGWLKNYEIVVRLQTEEREMRGLMNFRDLALAVELARLAPVEPGQNEEDKIEQARKALVTDWTLSQSIQSGGVMLKADTSPPIDCESMALQVGAMAGPLQKWPLGATKVFMPLSSGGVESEFVQFVLTSGELEARWVSRIPLDPEPAPERDRRAIAQYLDPKAFMAWIREILNDYRLDDGGGAWDEHDATALKTRKAGRGLSASEIPTLEEILKAWSRNPDSIFEADKRMRDYFEFVRKSSKTPSLELDIERRLAEFEQVWGIVRRTLLQGAGS